MTESGSKRVVVWGTGFVGRMVIAEIVKHPLFELVGVGVSNPKKVGRDVGEICGLAEPVGITATDDVDALIALKPDALVHYGPTAAHADANIALMTRLAVGLSWAGLTERQREQVTESFGRYISSIYADRFDSYAGQKLQVTGEQPNPAGVMVRSQIVKANGEPVNVDYMMRRNGDGWLISDIYLDSAISEVATRRSEFAAILRADGVDGLIAALNRKADMLTGTMAKAY